MHRPGTTLLHRTPAGVKLVVLFVVGIVTVLVRGPRVGPLGAVVLVTVALGLLAWSGAGLRTALDALRSVLVVAVLLAAWQVWQSGWSRAVETVGDLLGLVLLATVLTVTTPVDEILDTITRALGPLRRVGARPEAVALAFSLTIRAIPTTIAIADETRDAAPRPRARAQPAGPADPPGDPGRGPRPRHR